jgi:hypothetical protein
MLIKILLITTGALAPFFLAISGLSVFGVRISEGPNYFKFCIVSGLCWCGLFASIYAISNPTDRVKLLWLLPLILFAFIFPMAYLFLWLAFVWAAVNGRALP